MIDKISLCVCGNAILLKPYDSSQCFRCWVTINNPMLALSIYSNEYYGKNNSRIDSLTTQPPTPKPKKPCLYLGKVIDRAACNCPGKWVHECEKHGKCRRGMTQDGIQGCIGCPDFVEDD